MSHHLNTLRAAFAVPCLTVALLLAATPLPALEDAAKVPILYSSDLHHPPMDPDDHFDLATLLAIAEFDVRGIVLDCGARQLERPGSIPVGQILRLTGRKVPFEIGLGSPLASPTDDGRDQPAQFQKAVALILDTLRQSPQKVTLLTTGSLRDVAAAFNRDGELLRRKVARLYINMGNPALAGQKKHNEYNVNLDRHAYVRILQSGLPIYWCPCFDGANRQQGHHATYWQFVQRDVLQSAPLGLQNWFIFALSNPKDVDPVAFLSLPQQPDVRAKVWAMPRNMWSTASLLHAAGRAIYQRGPDDFVALQPQEAQKQNLADKAVDVYRFRPMRVTVTDADSRLIGLGVDLDPAQPNGFIFSVTDQRYGAVLTSCLKNLLADLGR